MAYDLRPKASGDDLNASKNPIRNNFSIIQTDFAVNHVAFDASGEGKHKFLQLPEQASAPTTAADEGGFYCKVGTSPTESNLYFRGESDGYEYQMTRSISASTGTFGNTTGTDGSGWTFLPGNLIMQWGLVPSGATSGTVTFPVAFTSSVFCITFGLVRNNSSSTQSVSINSANPIGLANFTYNQSSSTSSFYWHAIGK